jgi:hypothetical protein
MHSARLIEPGASHDDVASIAKAARAHFKLREPAL